MNTMNKVIAITSNTSWYLYNFRINTIKTLVERGHKVYAISPYDEYSDLLVASGCEHININIYQHGRNPLQDIQTYLAFYRIYKTLSPDIVLNFTAKNNIYSTLAADSHKSKIVNNVSGLGSVFSENNTTSKIVRSLYRLSQSKADVIFFQNEDDKKLFEDLSIGKDVKKIRIPGSGVDINRFKVHHRKNDGIIKFILIARMLYEKGIQYYVNAARILRKQYPDKVEFYLLGFIDDSSSNCVNKEVINSWSKEGIIIYLGSSDEVEEILKAMDCVVLPSFYGEGIPRSLLEGGAMGKPIITTNNTGCKETVDDGINGFLCEKKSLQSLITSLRKIIDIPYKNRIIMGDMSRIKIELEFCEEDVINEYLKVIE